MLSTLAGTVPQGDYQLTFRLYGDSKNSAPIWTETQTIKVLAGGTFSTYLGIITPLALPFDKQYFLGISVGNEAEINPRTPFTASPYSFNSQNTLKLQGRNVSGTAPSAGQVLKWNGTDWAPEADLNSNGVWVQTKDSLSYSPGSVTIGGGSFAVFGLGKYQPKTRTSNSFWWIPGKGALRAGNSNGTELSSAIGSHSVAMGYATQATGSYGTAFGSEASASGYAGTASGLKTLASGYASTSLGASTQATNHYTVAMGVNSKATEYGAVAIGNNNTASGQNSFAIGSDARATAN
jgi:hypothetical protein